MGDAGWWFSVPDADGEVWTFHVNLPGARRLWPGELVSVDFRYDFDTWAGCHSNLLIIDAEGTTVAWMGWADRISDVTPPSAVGELVPGNARCQGEDRCGTWTGYDVISVGWLGRTVTVPYGGEARIGDVRVVNGNYSRMTGMRCDDWDADIIRMAATTAPSP